MKTCLLAIFLLVRVVAPERLCAQSADSAFAEASRPNALKLALLGGVSAGVFVYTNIILSKQWWRDYPEPFHVNADLDYRYALNSDKFGHFYIASLLTRLYGKAFAWAGASEIEGLWWGAAIGVGFQTYSEIRDGFSRYGFSWGDFAANALGAAYPLAQRYAPVLRNFTFKISYYPSEQYLAGANRFIIDDYESTYNWLSVNVRGLLPERWSAGYPAWLNIFNIAVGHSVKGLDKEGAGRHELYLALDWNLEALPECGWLCDALKTLFGQYRLPAPAVRLLPEVVWYGLKF